MAETAGVRPLTNRFAAAALGIGAALLLAVTQAGGKGGLILWPLFGTTNQLVAGVTLLVVSVWLRQTGRPFLYTFIPMLLVVAASFVAMLSEVQGHFVGQRWLLGSMGSLILLLDTWVLLEGFRMLASRPNPSP